MCEMFDFTVELRNTVKLKYKLLGAQKIQINVDTRLIQIKISFNTFVK